jgi:glucoamylase
MLRVDLTEPAVLHWSTDGWETRSDTPTRDTGIGIHSVEISTDGFEPGRTITFTWKYATTGEWVGRDYTVTIAAGA